MINIVGRMAFELGFGDMPMRIRVVLNGTAASSVLGYGRRVGVDRAREAIAGKGRQKKAFFVSHCDRRRRPKISNSTYASEM